MLSVVIRRRDVCLLAACQVANLTDDRDNLSQRIRFLERQMVKLQEDLNR